MNNTGTPSSAPLNNTCICKRGVSINFEVIPGRVGTVDIAVSFGL